LLGNIAIIIHVLDLNQIIKDFITCVNIQVLLHHHT